ncbi:hypothetical protein V1525DRAFT_369776 [Lipomyces kononenkoae]|uniref:Uncharacterized protein n=1 Tax=Lipomyces kononenkoae TaxID=34357 RepID=A0ACC3TAI5_LIPKO
MSFLLRKILSLNSAVEVDHDEDAAPAFPALDSAQRANRPQTESDENDEEHNERSTVDESLVTATADLSRVYMPPPPPPSSVPRRQSAGGSMGPASIVASARAQPTLQSGTTPPSVLERPLPKFNFSDIAEPTRLAAPPKTAQTTAAQARRRREKVALEPGFSQLDWATLKNSGKDLSGRAQGLQPMQITLEELRMHSTKEDAWTTLGGKVYNISPYLRYHPGGVKELMRCAGRDGTRLFNLTHMWVNYERLLSNCFVGYLVPGGSS